MFQSLIDIFFGFFAGILIGYGLMILSVGIISLFNVINIGVRSNWKENRKGKILAIFGILFFSFLFTTILFVAYLEPQYSGTNNPIANYTPSISYFLYEQGYYRILGGFIGLIVIVVFHHHQIIKGIKSTTKF